MLLRKTCFRKAFYCYESKKGKEFLQPITRERHYVTKHKFCATTDDNDINSLSWWRKGHKNLKKLFWQRKNQEVKNDSKYFKRIRKRSESKNY